MDLKIFTWNCRGISNPRFFSRIQDVIARLKPNFLCLVETKANASRVWRFCNKLRRWWDWAAIPSSGLSGGILVLWKKSIGLVTPVASSRLVLHLVITTYDKTWILSTVYNSQILSDQKLLWRSLQGFSSLPIPWLLSGDFNAISSREEHRGGNFSHYASKSSFFSDFIFSNNLFDLGFSGSRFTWCNGQEGLARRWARLDRFLANSLWLLDFQRISNTHLPRIFSDHSPLLLSAFKSAYTPKKSFRFDNCWLDYAGCHESVLRA